MSLGRKGLRSETKRSYKPNLFEYKTRNVTEEIFPPGGKIQGDKALLNV